MAKSLISRLILPACAALALALPVQARAQSVRISGLSDVDFGQVANVLNDQSLSQTICLFSSGLNGGYTVTATGSGSGGAFALGAGSSLLPIEVQWAGSANQVSGQNLQPGVPLSGNTTNSLLSGCFLGLFRSASLIVVLRASETSRARAGSYSGSISLMIAPN
jgi:hypothetical protein